MTDETPKHKTIIKAIRHIAEAQGVLTGIQKYYLDNSQQTGRYLIADTIKHLEEVIDILWKMQE